VSSSRNEADRQLGADLGERHQTDRAHGDGPRLALESALSEHGFEPWHDAAGTVRMRNCPFCRLAELQPEVVCHMNLALIQGLVAGLGAESLNPVHDPEPEHCCVAIAAARP
jgi:predicted ArsR family transcriptional regulator